MELIANVQCRPIKNSREQLSNYLKNQKESNPGYRIIDVGGCINSVVPGLATAILDINKPDIGCENLSLFLGDIDSAEGWLAVEEDVKKHGKFEFSICSHTLEDISNPKFVCEKLTCISSRGYIAIPSKYKELSKFETAPPTYRGYIHHRWIFTILNNEFWGFPKISFLDFDAYFDGLTNAHLELYDDVSFWWKNSICLHIVNGNFLGPTPQHVRDSYRKGLTHDDIDRMIKRDHLITNKNISRPNADHYHLTASKKCPEIQNETAAYFGRFFQIMRDSQVVGGSEFGLGIMLFSLAVSINAATIIEIGRFTGFATHCLASALKLLDMGWQIPPSREFRQRPDINYDDFEFPKQRRIISIDPFPTRDARHLIDTSDLSEYVEFINKSSNEAGINDKADLIFIDGDHSYEGCKRDVEHYIPSNLRPGGYFVLHDYYGWYDELKQNKSPIKRVIDEIIESENFQHVLIDTGYMSFMIFRKPISLD